MKRKIALSIIVAVALVWVAAPLYLLLEYF